MAIAESPRLQNRRVRRTLPPPSDDHHRESSNKSKQNSAVRGAIVVSLLFAFLAGVSALESGIKLLGDDTQARLFSNISNPLAALFVGILGTVLVQSSSASTSTIVALVAAGALGVDDAVPMIMGANIGTTVTNTLVSLGHGRRSAEFERALAAATVHDFFNLMAVAILLPLELTTHVLSRAALRISQSMVGSAGVAWSSPIKGAVKAPVALAADIWGFLGLGGTAQGIALILTGLAAVLLALTFITKHMRAVMAQRVERSLNRVLSTGGGGVAILLGLVITVAVQSSSITTSILVPLAAAGVVTLRNIYPVTLGANIGTTITALLAALATSRPEALTVALVHTLFNVLAIVLIYPIPSVREIPIRMAEGLAHLGARHRSLAVSYVGFVFLFVPVVGLAIL